MSGWSRGDHAAACSKLADPELMSHELVNTFGRTLAETERLRRAKLRLYQAPLLQRLLRHARDTTEFYRTRLVFNCDSPEEVEEAWASIPILSRVEANANRDVLTSKAVPPETGGTIREETSGSTGLPFEFLKSGLTVAAAQALTERMFRWWKVDGSKCLARIAYDRKKMSPPPDGTTGVGWHSSGSAGLVHQLDAATDTDLQLDWLRLRRPDYLAAFSTNLHRLALRAIERRVELKFECIMSFGTRVDPAIRADCRSAFGAEIADSYGSQEVGHVATQCPDCGEYHLAVEASRIEILRDADDRPAKPGESGRFVATPFYNYAMPLIRYEMGDYAEAGTTNPKCSRGLPTIRRILGRTRNRLKFYDGTVALPELADFRFRELLRYKYLQVVQTELDRIEVRYVPDGGAGLDAGHAVEIRVRDVLRQPVKVTLVPLDTLGRITYGKIEDFISLIRNR
jgi:phenylacetate-CoA ligase